MSLVKNGYFTNTATGIPANGFTYMPSTSYITNWTFPNGTSGSIIANGTGGFLAETLPTGITQFYGIQQGGSGTIQGISQNITFPSAGTGILSFWISKRKDIQNLSQSIIVSLGSKSVSYNKQDNLWYYQTIPFTVSSTTLTQTLSISANTTVGGDQTVYISGISTEVFCLNEIGINDYLVSETSTDTTNSGYKINGQDIFKKYKKRATLGYGLNYKNVGYKLNGVDISTRFDFKLFTASSALNVVTNVANGVVIKVTGSGKLTFNFGLKKLGFAMIGGGGGGGPGYSGGGGGGAGELIYGTYDNDTHLINSLTLQIGSGGNSVYRGESSNGDNSSLVSNLNYINLTAYGGGGGGTSAFSQAGLQGGSGGGGAAGGGRFIGGGNNLHTGLTYNYKGNAGGAGSDDGKENGPGGGGGGAGSVGIEGTDYTSQLVGINGFNAGDGGNGYTVSFNNLYNVTLGGGGGGGSAGDIYYNSGKGFGGQGGGGDGGVGGGVSAPGNGEPNTGGGGGGGQSSVLDGTPDYGYRGGTGGSGVIYLYIDNSYIKGLARDTYYFSNELYNGVTYNVLTFTRSGSFTFTSDKSVKYMLIVGGGGSGGINYINNTSGGGGGAGGVGIYDFSVSTSSSLTLPSGYYTISIGDGGTYSSGNSSNGGNTSITNNVNFTETAYGGGGGGGSLGNRSGSDGNNNGNNYGSHGGVCNDSFYNGGSLTSYSYNNSSTGITYYFNNGGENSALIDLIGSGGGGASQRGGNGYYVTGTGYRGGNGGNGKQFIDGNYYGGGGGGGNYYNNNNTSITGGLGGGGNGGRNGSVGTPGEDNTGGGGGNGRNGGSGVVKIYYL